jgi:hypothetical protein
MVAWAEKSLFEEKIFSVENWLETAFHLCKQRWDSSIDWMEQQPISKILAMTQILKKFAEEQSDEMKKSRKRR